MLSEFRSGQQGLASQKGAGEDTYDVDHEELFHVDQEHREFLWRQPEFQHFASFSVAASSEGMAMVHTSLDTLVCHSDYTPVQNGIHPYKPQVRSRARGVETAQHTQGIAMLSSTEERVSQAPWHHSRLRPSMLSSGWTCTVCDHAVRESGRYKISTGMPRSQDPTDLRTAAYLPAGASKDRATEFTAANALLLEDAVVASLETHVLVKRVQHHLGLPLTLLKSLRSFMLPSPELTLQRSRREVSVLTRPQALSFVASGTRKNLELALGKNGSFELLAAAPEEDPRGPRVKMKPPFQSIEKTPPLSPCQETGPWGPVSLEAKKRLQHQWGLPGLALRSLKQFLVVVPPSPIHGDSVVRSHLEVKILTSAHPFLSTRLEMKEKLEAHMKTKIIERRWGLPRRALDSLRVFIPVAPPLSDRPKVNKETFVLPQGEKGIRRKPPSRSSRTSENLMISSAKAVQGPLAKKALEIRLGTINPMVQRSQDAARWMGKMHPLPKVILPGLRPLVPRPPELLFMGQAVLGHLQLNIIHKALMYRWRLPTTYNKSLAQMVQGEGAARVARSPSKSTESKFIAVQTPFISRKDREVLEWHVRGKRLQHTWGLPGLVQRSLHHLLPTTLPLHPQRGRPTEVVVSLTEPAFLDNGTRRELERNVQKRIIHQRWRLPRRVLQSLRRLQPTWNTANPPRFPFAGRREKFSRKAGRLSLSASPITEALCTECYVKKMGAAAPKRSQRFPRLGSKNLKKIELHSTKKCLEVQLEACPAIVKHSWKLTSSVCGRTLPKLLPPGRKALQLRKSSLPLVSQEDMELKTGSAQTLQQDSAFLPQETRTHLEHHLQKRKLQQQWGLPLRVLKSLHTLMPETGTCPVDRTLWLPTITFSTEFSSRLCKSRPVEGATEMEARTAPLRQGRGPRTRERSSSAPLLRHVKSKAPRNERETPQGTPGDMISQAARQTDSGAWPERKAEQGTLSFSKEPRPLSTGEASQFSTEWERVGDWDTDEEAGGGRDSLGKQQRGRPKAAGEMPKTEISVKAQPSLKGACPPAVKKSRASPSSAVCNEKEPDLAKIERQSVLGPVRDGRRMVGRGASVVVTARVTGPEGGKSQRAKEEEHKMLHRRKEGSREGPRPGREALPRHGRSHLLGTARDTERLKREALEMTQEVTKGMREHGNHTQFIQELYVKEVPVKLSLLGTIVERKLYLRQGLHIWLQSQEGETESRKGAKKSAGTSQLATPQVGRTAQVKRPPRGSNRALHARPQQSQTSRNREVGRKKQPDLVKIERQRVVRPGSDGQKMVGRGASVVETARVTGPEGGKKRAKEEENMKLHSRKEGSRKGPHPGREALPRHGRIHWGPINETWQDPLGTPKDMGHLQREALKVTQEVPKGIQEHGNRAPLVQEPYAKEAPRKLSLLGKIVQMKRRLREGIHTWLKSQNGEKGSQKGAKKTAGTSSPRTKHQRRETV
uniref:Uncharacterized protein n=1 Tax=Sphaerodactylus townsendi TaxID=933632 RepID=A0ACB8EP23_9SAUR